jgi:hypothetical protein
MFAVKTARVLTTAELSFAAIRDRRKFGIAIAAMIRIMATTTSNSIKLKPFRFRLMIVTPPLPNARTP